MSEFAGKERIYTRQFWLLCVSSLLFLASFNMLIPELPAFLTSLGGAEYKGLIISLFTLTAMVSRPFSGKLADKFGRVPVILFGAVVCVLCSLIYPLISTVSAFLWLRLAHGFSTGFTPTGQSAYLSDIIPSQRRGEAMGLLGTASALGLISAVIVMGIKETLKERQPFSLKMLAIKKSDLFKPLVLVPCIVMALTTYAYGTVFTLLPDFGVFVGISNKGFLFAFLTISSLLVRLLAGKLSDRLGRAPVMMIVTALIIIAMLIMGSASSALMLIAGVTLYGFAHGATTPTLLAWATDLSDEHHKGRGLASVYICMELGIGAGAFVSGMVYANRPSFFILAFAISATMAAIAFLFLLSRKWLFNV